MGNIYEFFATCPKGLEGLLADELEQLGAQTLKQTVAGVHFSGSLEVAYRACLWSRLANRILLPLSHQQVNSADELYAAVQAVDWLQHMRSNATFLVNFSGTSRSIRNTHFGAQKVKDGIVDQVRQATRSRPMVDKAAPDLRIHVRLDKGVAHISLDLSGESLHRRGYRVKGGLAPLKENLAAALLYRCQWPEIAAKGGDFIDPMCGSGTLLIEAALMAADVAPGLLRRRFGFEYWLGHDSPTWQSLLEEAKARKAAGLAGLQSRFYGFDAHPGIIKPATTNAERAGVSSFIEFKQRDLAGLQAPAQATRGLLLTNPPYGERLNEVPVLVHLYRHLGARLRESFEGWRAGVFTGNPELGKGMGLRATKRYNLYNGAIESKLLILEVEPTSFVDRQPNLPPAEAPAADSKSEGAVMFGNRLRKNLKQLSKWARKEQIECYRVYDADMPEYALAVDLYGDWAHVQEYAPPASVDPGKAQRRLQEALAAMPEVLGLPAERIVLKQRRRQKGSEQYQRHASHGEMLEITEGGCRLLVNLTDYLDTGLFLDHRPLRMEIQARAKGKRFLNLFCYTGTASVHAAKGGAVQTTSVDMSATYLEWARKNFALNGFGERSHRFEQANCLEWLKTHGERYELIFMDPPTFSNSKRMDDVLDIQRDHVALILDACELLAPGGALLFSNNHRRFKLDEQALSGLLVEEVTDRTIDRDFKRNARIHRCWEIRR